LYACKSQTNFDTIINRQQLSSAQVVSKVLPKNSSNIFLRDTGVQPTSPTKAPTAKEKALQEQLAAEKQTSTEDEVNALKQNAQNIEETGPK
jgi:hypothetical protein